MSTLVQFTPMTVDDVPAIGELEILCFPAPWSPETYLHELRHNPRSFYFVVRPVPEAPPALAPILAYGGYWLMGDEAHIVTLASHPDWRGRGLGEWLMLNLIARIWEAGVTSVTLEVRVGNLAARQLYEKWGFEQVGLRKRYYRDNGEDALLLTLFHVDHPLVQGKILTGIEEAVLDL